jgi:phage shock protein PspC (stress-responsive transcriptional regulator)
MNKVIIINLNGNAYQLEEDAYDALRAYLDSASRRLEGNPDRDEIIADIEQAIADKFRAVLGVNKSVVLASEVRTVIAEMGPVEDASEAGAPQGGPSAAAGAPEAPKAAQGEAAGAPKRLYRINEGAMLAGVCNGLAAYLGLDVSLVRTIFLVLTIVWGFGAVVYLIMALVIPSATTPAEKFAAYGAPSTSQEFIRRAREGYYGGMKAFRDRREYREWKRKFKQEMRGWRQNLRREIHMNAQQWAHNWRQHWAQHSPPVFFGGWLLAPFFALASLIVTLGVLYAVYSILVHGSAFGLSVPASLPTWAAIIIFLIVVQFIVWPLKAMRHAFTCGCGPGYYHPFVHFWNAVSGIALLVVVVWLFTHHPSQVHEAVRSLAHAFRDAAQAFKEWWDSL